jgi:hypothetical protein
MSSQTWSQIKTATAEAAGTAWIVETYEDPRYITFTDPATLRSFDAYHVDDHTVVNGRQCTLRVAAQLLAEELQTAQRFGGLGSFDRLLALAKVTGAPQDIGGSK